MSTITANEEVERISGVLLGDIEPSSPKTADDDMRTTVRYFLRNSEILAAAYDDIALEALMADPMAEDRHREASVIANAFRAGEVDSNGCCWHPSTGLIVTGWYEKDGEWV